MRTDQQVGAGVGVAAVLRKPRLTTPSSPPCSYRGGVEDAKPRKLMEPETIIPGSKIDLVRKRNVIRRHNEMEKRKPKPKPKVSGARAALGTFALLLSCYCR